MKTGIGLSKFYIVATILIFFYQSVTAQEVYDQIKWDSLTQLPAADKYKVQNGVAGAFAGTSNNAMIIAGGANFPDSVPWKGGIKKYYADIYVYDFLKGASGKWLSQIFNLPFHIGYGASVTTRKGILCMGGMNEDSISSQTFFLTFNRDSSVIDIQPFARLPHALYNLAATNIENWIYIAGGEDSLSTSNNFYRINIETEDPQWEKLPSWEGPSLSQTVLAAQADGHGMGLYLIGGKYIGKDGLPRFSSEVRKYDPAQNKWNRRSRITGSQNHDINIGAGTGFETGSNYIILAGGNTSSLFDKIISLNRKLDTATLPVNKKQYKQQLDSFLNHHPGFDNKIYLYNTITDVWTEMAEFPFDLPVTLNAFQYNKNFILPSGEIRPGVRSPQITAGTIRSIAHFSIIDYVILSLYFLLMLGIGYWASKRQKTTEDYFKAAERIPSWAAGVSIFGTQLSAITFMAIPAKTFGTDWTYFFLQMTIIMAFPLISKFFIPFYKNLSVTTAYEYLEKRFNYSVRLLGSVLFILFQTARIAIVLLLPSLALTIVTGIPVESCIFLMGFVTIIYTFKGGIEAVIWTDVVQVFILLGGALLCLFLIPFRLEFTSSEIWQKLTDFHKLKIADFRLDFSQPTIWVMFVGGLAINTVTYGSDQTIVQRYLTTKNIKQARKSLRLNAIMTLPAAVIFFSIGTLLFVFYSNFPSKVNIAPESQDVILPWFIVSELPIGLIGLLIAAIFAAAMSTLSSSLNSISTSIITDIYKRWAGPRSDRHFFKLAQALTIIVGITGTGLAMYMAEKGITSLWDQFNMLLGLFTGNLGGVFLLGIFTRKANGPGALAGLLTSGVLQYILKIYTPLHFLMFAFTGVVSCMLSGYLFSLLFTKTTNQTEGLTIYTLRNKENKRLSPIK